MVFFPGMRWPPRLILLSIFLQWLILLPVSRAMLNGFTTVVEAGKVNCFYENIDSNRTLEMEYQVRVVFYIHYSVQCCTSMMRVLSSLKLIYFRSAVQTTTVCDELNRKMRQ